MVRGAIIDDGLGLMGGGGSPGSIHLDMPNRLTSPDSSSTPDPYALLEMSSDIRPADYASSFAFAASQASENRVSIAVVAKVRPAWLSGIVDQFGVEEMPLTDALAAFAGVQH